MQRQSPLSLLSAFFGCTLFLASHAMGEPASPPAPAVQDVIIVYKTHFDIGYTDLATNVLERYRTTMIDQALKVADESRTLPPEQQFVWTLPGWPMKKILDDWPGQTPERRGSIMRAFGEGRFALHALPFTTHTELLEAEDLVRGLGFSSAISRANKKPLPRDAKMTDVPSHSWILPTLLKHAGVDFLHLGCNPASRSPEVPRLFWWEGPDGSRVLTFYSAGDYGTGILPPPGWPHKTWLAMMMTGDNHGPPTPEEVRGILQQAKDKLPGAKARVGHLSDFYDAIVAEKPELPVVRGDMPDTWIHGPMSDPAGAKLARNIRPSIASTELLGTELRVWGVMAPDPRAPVADAYEQSLLYGEHTWGGAFWWIYGKYVLKYGDEWVQERAKGQFKRIESSWEEHSAYISRAAGIIEPVQQADLAMLARGVSVTGPRIVVFNPLPWSRSGIATARVPLKQAAVVDPSTGKEIPCETSSDGTVRFLAADVPPSGYRTYTLREGTVPAPAPAPQSNLLENAFFKITLDPEHGTIRSLIEKRSGREWVDPAAPQAPGQYLHETFDTSQVQSFVKAYVKINAEWGTNELGKPTMPSLSNAPYRASSPSGFQLRWERTPASLTAVMEAPAGAAVPYPVTTRITLHEDAPWIDLEMTLQGKPFTSLPEAGWICLPFKISQPTFHLARLGGIVDPSKDIVPGCNFHTFALNGGMTVTDSAGAGIGLCGLDSPLVSLGEPGCWKYSRAFAPRASRVYVNLFNNQWSTNFRLWNSGTWSARVRLWAVEGREDEKSLITPAEEARTPMLASYADGAAGQMTPTKTGLQLSTRGVKVTAFGPNPDGEGLVLRLWELAGHAGVCDVRLPAGMIPRTIQPADLRGRPIGKPIPVDNGKFRAPIHRYAPASFLLKGP